GKDSRGPGSAGFSTGLASAGARGKHRSRGGGGALRIAPPGIRRSVSLVLPRFRRWVALGGPREVGGPGGSNRLGGGGPSSGRFPPRRRGCLGQRARSHR